MGRFRYLARDEMRVIGEDGWEEEVWGVVGEGKMGEGTVQKEKGPWLRFLFGRDDHWVADEVRDGLMKRRAGGEGGVKMEIDEEGIPHSFCISELGGFFLFCWVELRVWNEANCEKGTVRSWQRRLLGGSRRLRRETR